MARTRPGRILAPLLVVLSLIGVATLFAVPQEPAGEQLTAEEEAALQRYVERFQKAQQLLGGGYDERAAKILRELIEERPDVGAVHHALAVLLRYQNEPEEATAEFLRAVELSPDDGAILRDAGMNLLDHDQPVRALPLLARAHELWPDDLEAVLFHGHALLRVGRNREAVGVFRNAVEVDSNSVDAHVGLAHALVPVDPEESLAIVEKMNHNFFDVCLVHGLGLTRTGRYEDAAPLLEKAVSMIQPGPVGSRYLAAATEALVLGGDVERAGKAALRWYEVDGPGDKPARVPACFALALCRAAVGDHGGALTALDGARPGPVPEPIRRHLALFAAVELRQAGRGKESAAALEAMAGAKQESFEREAARRLLGRIDAAAFAKLAEQPNRRNDIAWVESLVAGWAGDAAAAESYRKQAREASDPPGEHPGLLVRAPTK